MKFNIVTLIPEIYENYFNFSVFWNGLQKNIFSYILYNLRDFGIGKHKKVDDYPYGGGKGMILRCESLEKCLTGISNRGKTVLMSPRGKVFSYRDAKKFADYPILTIINGRYEGIDERIIDLYVDEQVSIGDFVLTGGDPAALCFLDAIIRQIPGFLDCDALDVESFENNLLEYPQYTRPESFKERKVPEILLSGKHKDIEKWRKKKQIEITKENRPDLYKKYLEDNNEHFE